MPAPQNTGTRQPREGIAGGRIGQKRKDAGIIRLNAAAVASMQFGSANQKTWQTIDFHHQNRGLAMKKGEGVGALLGMLANQHGAYTPKQRGQAAAELCILATTTGVKRMSDQTKGDVKDRLRQWIELCEQSQTTGEATDIMQSAIDRIAYLETEHGDPMIKWMSAESLEMHIVRLKQQLSEQAMRVPDLQKRLTECQEQLSELKRLGLEYMEKAECYKQATNPTSGNNSSERALAYDAMQEAQQALFAYLEQLEGE